MANRFLLLLKKFQLLSKVHSIPIHKLILKPIHQYITEFWPLWFQLQMLNCPVSFHLKGNRSVSERILRKCRFKLRRELNVPTLLPYLNKYRLITADVYEKLTLQSTNATKVERLVAELPRSGEDFLERFIKCLRHSAKEEPGTCHEQIADILEEEAKCQYSQGKNNCLILLWMQAWPQFRQKVLLLSFTAFVTYQEQKERFHFHHRLFHSWMETVFVVPAVQHVLCYRCSSSM